MKKLFVSLLIIFSCVLPNSGQAQTASGKPIKLVYDIYNKGLHVITIKASYTLTPDRYTVNAHFVSAGMASWVFSLDTYSSVSGSFQNNRAIPNIFESHGMSKKEKFNTSIDFNGGNQALIKTMVPARDPQRDALTSEQLQHSLDVMSAMAELLYRVRDTGKCDDQFNLLDGLRSFTFRSQTVGEQEMPSSWTSPYKGKALLCKAVAQQVGGLKHSRNRALMAQPQPGSIWFKDIDGIGILPVRFDFNHPKMGVVTGILRQVSVKN